MNLIKRLISLTFMAGIFTTGCWNSKYGLPNQVFDESTPLYHELENLIPDTIKTDTAVVRLGYDKKGRMISSELDINNDGIPDQKTITIPIGEKRLRFELYVDPSDSSFSYIRI